MKIGLDISPIIYGTGVSVYLENLINGLLEVDQKNEYLFFFSSLRRKYQNPKLKIRSFKIPPTLLDLLWNRFHCCPIECFLGNLDVFHASDWTQPPSKKAKLVTTIHDLSFLRMPETVNPKVLAVQKRRLEWVKKEADAVIAVSQATKKEIIELLSIPEEKITVIHEALPADVGKESKNIKKEAIEKAKKKYQIKKPYFFAYGSQAPRKNIKRLIQAFKKLKKDCQLVIVGEYRPEAFLPDNVVVAGFIPRSDYRHLFAGALGLAYPSIYEGFGLMILEAFALRVPVLTSSLSSMPEVAGKAAILANPESTEEIAQGLKKIAKGGKEIEDLIKKGKQRLKLFSWKKAAKETIKIYQKAGKK